MATILPASTADVGLLSACAFFGNIGASLTGFGQAIIFLFVWQIVELAGYNGNFKSAVFIQALSLFSMQPLVLYKANVWRNAHRRVLWLFVPITLVSTPLGQLVSDRVPTDIVQAVAGVLVTFVACWELYCKRNWFLSPCKKTKMKKTDAEEETAAAAAAAAVKEEEASKEREGCGGGVQEKDVDIVAAETESQEQSKGVDKASIVDDDDKDDAAAKRDPELLKLERETKVGVATTDSNSSKSSEEQKQKTEVATNPKDIYSIYASLAVGPTQNSTTVDCVSNNNTNPTNVNEEEEEQLRIGVNKATFITLLAGGASGFLGGMVAIRGPPLIFYFLHPPHPISFNKNSQRATGVVIMFCNVMMRMIFYLMNTFSLNSSGKIGFVKEDWRLYLSVIVCSIVGGLVGTKLFEYLKDSQNTIRSILAVFLLLCGVSLLFSGLA